MKLFIPARQDERGAVLVAAEIRYLLRVRRLADGDSVQCLGPDGNSWLGLVRIYPDKVMLERTGGSLEQPELDDDVRIHLVQGIPKGRKLDDIVRQACETGVYAIHPWHSQHAVPRIEEKWETKQARFEAILREAAQQSGNRHKPLLQAPADTGAILRTMKDQGARGIVFYEKQLAEGSLHRYLFESKAPVFVFVGPEGGISSGELDLFVQAGCFVATLGKTILRTETAALAAVAGIQALLRETNLGPIVE